MTRERDRIQENANKYIVKKCPRIKTTEYYLRGELITEHICTSNRQEFRLCQNRTDCVIKQVIEECKWETNIDVNDRGDLAERILSSFDIEEINK